MKWLFKILGVGVMVTALAPAWAQDYPARPINMVVPVTPAGSTDVLARMVAKEMSAILKQPIVVENKPGAGGNLGTDFVVRAPKDGYTLLFTFGGAVSTNVVLYGSSLPYDPLKDLAPIGLVVEVPEFLFVHPGVPASRVADLVKLLQANPGKYAMASAGVGTGTHIIGELFKMSAKVTADHIPYKGESSAATDLIANHVPMMIGSSVSLPYLKTGQLRALAVTTPTRSPLAPDVPTFAEEGYPQVNLSPWLAAFAPAGTPPAVLQKLQRALAQVVGSSSFGEQVQKMGFVVLQPEPAKLTERMHNEIRVSSEIVKATGLKIDK